MAVVGLLLGRTGDASGAPPAVDGAALVDDLVRSALADNPSLAVASERARAKRIRATVASAPMDPMVSANLMGMAPDMVALDLMVSQAFAPPGSLKAARAAGEAAADAADAERLGAALALEADVRSAAAMQASAEARLRALASARLDAAASIDAVKARVVAGTMPMGDLVMAEMTVAEIDDRIAATTADRDTARAMLARMTGRMPDSVPLPALPDALPPTGTSPMVASMEAMRRMSASDAAMARAERLPDVTLSAGWSFRTVSMWDDMASVGVSTSLPVFSGRKQGARLASANASVAAAEADRTATELDVREMDAELVARLSALRRRADSARTMLHSARAAADALRTAWMGGGEIGAMLDAERRVHEITEMEAMIRANGLSTYARLAAVRGVSLVAPE